MIIQGLLDPIFLFLKGLINTLPEFNKIGADPNSIMGVLDKMSFGVWVIGLDTFLLMIGTIAFWTTVTVAWSIFEWAYKKIPGVD